MERKQLRRALAPLLGPVAGGVRTVARILVRDIGNVARYGPNTPRYGQRVWIDPLACSFAVDRPLARRLSAKVVVDDLRADRPVENVQKIRFCIMHWRDGISWSDTGAYEHMLEVIGQDGRAVDGTSTLDDVVARYSRLDEIFAQIQQEGRLRSVRELPGWTFRELGGVYVHLDRDAGPIFGLGGSHRLAMARILELPEIPAQIGVVHRDVLSRWRKQVRSESTGRSV